MIALGLLLSQVTALASAGLSATVSGNALNVTWTTFAGEGVLTVYQNDWPICVREVSRAGGSVSIPLGTPQGNYFLRLNTGTGCYTAEVTVHEVKPKPVETEKPTEVPITIPATTPVPAETPEATCTPLVTNTPAATSTPAPVATSASSPTPAPTKRAGQTVSRSDLAAQVVELVNEERAGQGLSRLRVDTELTRAACVRAGELVQSFSHTRPDGSNWSTVSSSAYGENIARGQNSADKVMASWLTSQGHRENILRASYGSIGVCVVVSDGVVYWEQLFGR